MRYELRAGSDLFDTLEAALDHFAGTNRFKSFLTTRKKAPVTVMTSGPFFRWNIARVRFPTSAGGGVAAWTLTQNLVRA